MTMAPSRSAVASRASERSPSGASGTSTSSSTLRSTAVTIAPQLPHEPVRIPPGRFQRTPVAVEGIGADHLAQAVGAVLGDELDLVARPQAEALAHGLGDR